MKNRLRLFYFLQFAVWGCYLTSLGQLLGTYGLGRDIAWFYAAIGIVSLITPTLFGYISDRYIPAIRLLRLCHFVAGSTMLAMFFYTAYHDRASFIILYSLYLFFLAFYMPTMALANTTAFGILKGRGEKPVEAFPAIRVWGTIGFILAMWLINSTYWYDGTLGLTLSDTHPFAKYRFQYNHGQLLCSSLFAFAASAFAFSLPTIETKEKMVSQLKNTNAFTTIILQFKSIIAFLNIPYVRTFLIFIVFSGVCLQISNGFATPYISHFMGDSNYSGLFAGANATMLFSLSQIAEVFMILLVGISLKKLGIKWVLAIGLFAWCLRFLTLGLGNPGNGFWLLVVSMIIYGVGFNFVTIAGHIYIDRESPEQFKGTGQGAMMLMSNGIGATCGTLVAGTVVNHYCFWQPMETAEGQQQILFMGDWFIPWMIFAAYAFLISVCWLIAKSNQRFILSESSQI